MCDIFIQEKTQTSNGIEKKIASFRGPWSLVSGLTQPALVGFIFLESSLVGFIFLESSLVGFLGCSINSPLTTRRRKILLGKR
jgi:hypothetical protein